MNIELCKFDEKRENIIAVANDNGGLFTEAAEEFLDATKKFEINSAKIEAYTEATEREFQINIAKAELKCMQEDGTMDDLVYLEEAAEGGAVDKLRKLIAAIIESFKEWVSRIKTKVLKRIASAEARQTIKTAEKKIKLNPILARKKVEITSTKNTMSVINTYKSKVDKIAAKTVAKGVIAEHEIKTLNATKEDFREAFKSSIAGKAAVKTITVAGLVAQLSSDIEKLPSYIDKMEAQHTTILKKLQGTLNPEAAAAASTATNACANFRSELAREEVNTVIDSVMEEMKVLKSAVAKGKGKTEVKPVKESADEFDPLFNELDYEDSYEESADDDFLTELEDIFND